jgi:hypothetical protein
MIATASKIKNEFEAARLMLAFVSIFRSQNHFAFDPNILTSIFRELPEFTSKLLQFREEDDDDNDEKDMDDDENADQEQDFSDNNELEFLYPDYSNHYSTPLD